MIGAVLFLALVASVHAAPADDDFDWLPLGRGLALVNKDQDAVPKSDDDDVEWLPLSDHAEVPKDLSANRMTVNVPNDGNTVPISFNDDSAMTYTFTTAGTYMQMDCFFRLRRRDEFSFLRVAQYELASFRPGRRPRRRAVRLYGNVNSVTLSFGLDVSASQQQYGYTPFIQCDILATGQGSQTTTASPTTAAPTTAAPTTAAPTTAAPTTAAPTTAAPTTAAPTTAAPTTVAPTTTTLAPANSCEYCRATTSRVINGSPIGLEERNFYVSVHSRGSFVCGGTIISAEWILTAAHCVESNRNIYSVRFEASDRSGPGSLVPVAQTVRHPQYPRNTGRVEQFDIALLRLATPIAAFTDTIRPACLNSLTNNELDNQVLQVIGLGDVSDGGADPSAVLFGDMEVLRDDECPAAGLSLVHPSHYICVRPIAPVNTNICGGDSGGPLIHNRNGYNFVVGATSYGPILCETTRPAAYAEVEEFLPWIQATSGVTACGPQSL